MALQPETNEHFIQTCLAEVAIRRRKQLKSFGIGYLRYLAPRGFALARPLPRVPRRPPRAAPPLPAGGTPPRVAIREVGAAAVAGVENFEVAFEEGGLSTKEVSVVLQTLANTKPENQIRLTEMSSPYPYPREAYLNSFRALVDVSTTQPL
jgi:hypothetical protein